MATDRDEPLELTVTAVREAPGSASAFIPPPVSAANFTIEELLGAGGMGVVFRARDATGRDAALKVMNRTDNAQMRVRFAKEANIRIAHPNIVEVYESGVLEDGSPYIAFELLRGEPLNKRLTRGRLKPGEVVELGKQVLRGLIAAHGRAVVHRDLKPSNLFVCEGGIYKVLDFGIALDDTDDVRLTQEGAVLGTPNYLAPEQARGERTVDHRADLWSLGVVLYEALSGVSPFERGSRIGTLIAVILDQPPELRELAPEASPELAEVIARAMAKDKSRRWPNAQAFLDALENLTYTGEDAPIVAVPAIAPLPIRSDERRVIAVVLCEGLRELARAQLAVEERGGAFLELRGDRAAGIFGGSAWVGDEMWRAADAALAIRSGCARVSVASGRAGVRDGSLAGEAVRAAERGLALDLAGVAMSAELARALGLEAGGAELVELTAAALEEAAQKSDVAPAPMLGRNIELARARELVERLAREGRGGTMLVHGPPGIGKSRLREELEARAEAQAEAQAEADRASSSRSIQLLSGRAEHLSRSSALSLFASVLRAHFGAAAGFDAIDAAVARVLTADQGGREVALFLAELLGHTGEVHPSLEAARADLQLMDDRLRLAVVDYLEALARARPVLLVLEDLQWADDESLDLLGYFVEHESLNPIGAFLTTRPELLDRLPHAFDSPDVVRIELRPLSEPQVAELAARAALRPLPPELNRALSERTGGNPLFVEEIARAWLESGALEQLDPASSPIPLTVESAIQSRLDHLPPLEKELLKRAAIFGRPFSYAELSALDGSISEAHLASVVRRDLIRRSTPRGGGEAGYRFNSSLIREVAERMLPDELSRWLHRRAALALKDRTDVPPEEIAGHFDAAELGDEAARWWAAAAHRAARRGDSASVVRFSSRALERGIEENFALWMAQSDALRFLGRHEEQGRALAGALASAANEAESARALTERAAWLSGAGRSEEALEHIERAVRAAAAAADDEALALALGRRVLLYSWLGRIDEAEASLAEVSALVNDRQPALRALEARWTAHVANARGDLGRMRAAFESALALDRAAGDVRRAAGSATNLADAYNRVGAYEEAERAIGTALEDCRRVGHRIMEGYALANLGYTRTMLGRHQAALTSLDHAAALAETTQQPRLAAIARRYRLRTLLALGRTREVIDDGTRAAEEAGAKQMLPQQIDMLATITRAHLAEGDVASALDCSASAMALLERAGGIDEDEAGVYLARAAALERSGDASGAARVLELGRARLLEIASGIADPGWRSRFLENVVAHRALLGT